MGLTRIGRLLTGLVLAFAAVNVAVGVATGPWFAVVMLGFLLVCQVGITCWESHESAAQECDSVTSILRPSARRSLRVRRRKPVQARRVQDGSISRVEPRFDPTWDELTRLEWRAAVVAHDTGMSVSVSESDYWSGSQRYHGFYDIQAGSTVSGPHTFAEADSVLSGISAAGSAFNAARAAAGDASVPARHPAVAAEDGTSR